MIESQQQIGTEMTSYWKTRAYMLLNLPMGLLSGLRIREVSETQTVVSVPYKNLNKNPFKSIYFAVMSMAAEMSTAVSCLMASCGHKPSVAMIIVGLKATFLKKATGRAYFTCEENHKAFEAVAECIETGESQEATFKTIGRLKDGTVVAEFEFTWSFKQRKS